MEISSILEIITFVLLILKFSCLTWAPFDNLLSVPPLQGMNDDTPPPLLLVALSSPAVFLPEYQWSRSIFSWEKYEREGGSGWGTHVNPWLFHSNVWQNSLQKKKKKDNTTTICDITKKKTLFMKKRQWATFGTWTVAQEKKKKRKKYESCPYQNHG